MTTKKKSRRKLKSHKKIRNLLFSIMLLLISAAISYVYFVEQRFENVMYPGVVIEGVDLTEKTKEESIQILREKYSNPILNKKINIKAPSRTYVINYSELNPQYNIIETVDKALAYGKDLNLLNKYKLIKNPKINNFQLDFTYNHKPVDDMINSISKEVNKAPVEATISLVNGTFKVSSEKAGFQLDDKKLNEEILSEITKKDNEDINIEAPIEIIEPKVTGEKLRLVNSKIGTYSTSFVSSAEGRSTNIALATQSINGTVLMPGDTFSFNQIVGERTKERGYKEAGVIINQQLDSGLGGGICQVSSTLYNALLRGNIKTTERVHHTIPVAYVDLGSDATVDWGNIDLKFKNTYDYPIYIEGYIKNKILYFNLYSNSTLAKRTYTITTEVYEVIEPTIKYIDDPKMLEGKTEVVKQSRKGYRVRTYRNIYENGNYINRELVTTDYYIPINGVIKKGTKKAN